MIDLNTCTIQEACDYAVKKIVEQGERCMQAANPQQAPKCAYQDESGEAHCSVGWLAPNNEELMGYTGTLAQFVEVYEGDDACPEFFMRHMYQLCLLQSFHDDDSVSGRKHNLKYLGEAGIDTSPKQYNQWVQMGPSA